MLSRRRFLQNTIAGSSMLALSSAAPRFLTQTAHAAESGKEKVLVVVQLGGGNDGLNTVVPYGDDLYHKARPTIRLEKGDVVKIDDHIGLHPALQPLESLLEAGNLAILQGIGYPNPNRSHFESMDIWHTADPRRRITNGWLGRGIGLLKSDDVGIPAFHIGSGNLPLALEGSATGVPSLNSKNPFKLHLGDEGNLVSYGTSTNVRGPVDFLQPGSTTGTTPMPQPKNISARQKLIHELAAPQSDNPGSMLQFVQQTSLRTFTTIEELGEVLKDDSSRGYTPPGLATELSLVSRMIAKDFGTRIYYLSLDGFDTHSGQANDHRALLDTLASAVAGFFQQLRESGNDERVLLLSFSEFGRRVRENGSEGTDHGAASCMFAAGPAVKGGLIGAHPSLEKLDIGDLKFHTDFRRVYATVLDRWLGCESHRVLGEKFEHVDLLS